MANVRFRPIPAAGDPLRTLAWSVSLADDAGCSHCCTSACSVAACWREQWLRCYRAGRRGPKHGLSAQGRLRQAMRSTHAFFHASWRHSDGSDRFRPRRSRLFRLGDRLLLHSSGVEGTSAGVAKVFETGSRGMPSLITSPSLTVTTYMRPTNASGRETSRSPQPIRWTYRHGRFERS